MNNIVLIGMPGAGKSTVGVVLAKMAGMRFLDTDLSIQEYMGERLQDTIDREGKQAFLRIENIVVSGVRAENTVIATGGSVVYGQSAVETLRENGVLVYLRYGLDTIASRLTDLDTRGVAMAPGETIQDLYEERTPRYEAAADVTVDCEGKSIEQIVVEILSAVNR